MLFALPASSSPTWINWSSRVYCEKKISTPVMFTRRPKSTRHHWPLASIVVDLLDSAPSTAIVAVSLMKVLD